MERMLRLYLVFIFVGISISTFAKNTNASYQVLFDKVIENYSRSNGFEYDVVYKDKCFDCDSFKLFQYHVALLNNSRDTVFGSYFYYRVSFEGTLTYKFYNGSNLYVLDTKDKSNTSFDIFKNQTSPITNATDGTIIQMNVVFQPEKLRKLFFSGKNTISFLDTVMNGTPYVSCKTKFNNDEDFTDIYRTVFVNYNTKLIDRIITHASYKNQTEIRNITYQNFKPKEIDLGYLDSLYTAQKNNDYTDVVYHPRQRDTLTLLSVIPPFKAKLYPDNQAIDLPKVGKITVLDFWYTACLPCTKVIPDLNKLFEKYKSKVDFCGVNASDDDIKNQQRITDFQNRTPIRYPIALANWDDLQALKITGFPTLYIIDGEGKLAFKALGYDESIDLYKLLDSKLSELTK
jgi:thiol-disulfide isomerase/thioredoxin